MFELTGKVAIVTGGNGGIGLGMARGLAKAGARVVVAARNAEKSSAVVDELKSLGATACFIPVDVAEEESVNRLMDQALREYERIDILVNNAGISIRKSPQELTLDEWHRVIGINLTGVFLCARAAYPHMKKLGGGKIINIGSMMSIFGASFAAAYGSSKGGVIQLTKSLAVAWAGDNIQVNAVLPGWIETDLTRQARKEIQGLYERTLARSPSGRWGAIDDFNGIAVFLASGASSFITGAVIPVDGGYSSNG